jgi:hypothetical protein
MTAFKLSLCAAGLLLMGCGSESPAVKEPPMGEVLPNLPLPAHPQLVERSHSKDALQLTIRSPSDIGSVTQFYRDVLSRGKWRLVSDVKNPDGSTSLYAEQDGPPLWVRIWKSEDQPGTMVQLTGAMVGKDSVRRAGDSTVRRHDAKS